MYTNREYLKYMHKLSAIIKMWHHFVCGHNWTSMMIYFSILVSYTENLMIVLHTLLCVYNKAPIWLYLPQFIVYL